METVLGGTMNRIVRVAMAVFLAAAFCLVNTGLASDNAPAPSPQSLIKEVRKSTRKPAPLVPGESAHSRKAFRAHRRQLRNFNATTASWGEKALDDAALSELTGNLGLPLIAVDRVRPGVAGGRYIRLSSTYLLSSRGVDPETGLYRTNIVPLVFIESAYTDDDPPMFDPIALMEPFGNEISASLDGENYNIFALDGTPPFFFDKDFKDYYAYGSHLRYWTLAKWPYDSGEDVYVYGDFPGNWPLVYWPYSKNYDGTRIRGWKRPPRPNVTVVTKDGTITLYTNLEIELEHISSYDDDGCGDDVGGYWTWAGLYAYIPVNGVTLGGRSDRDSWLWVDLPVSTMHLRVRDIYIDDKITYTGPRSLGSLDASLTLGAKIYLTTHR